MSDLTFINNNYWVLVLTGAVVLFIVFFIKEWPRKNSSNFAIRIVVALVAILALVALVLKPASKIEVEGKPGVLLTAGYEESQLDSLKKLYPQLKELTYEHYFL